VVHLVCSVAQGSVLGPRMFVEYTADLADLVAGCLVNFHSFADDSQSHVVHRHCTLSGVASEVR